MWECICTYLISNINALMSNLNGLHGSRFCNSSGCFSTEREMLGLPPRENTQPATGNTPNLLNDGNALLLVLIILLVTVLSFMERRKRKELERSGEIKIRRELPRGPDPSSSM
eukprot:TRINITY_DN11099_c0_g1_i1.p1 TRINITY_DN11099_c0_g1~~TRINITY_DN11099_c0_g1_i1.p1  ORF type:complete len:113 (-),score=19.17 TRINITY_DN11099_c0_g1_i1:29-367(-)